MDVDKICIVVSYHVLFNFSQVWYDMCNVAVMYDIISLFFFIYGDIYGWFDSSLLRV